MYIQLRRFAYLNDCTRGVLTVEGKEYQTIERPWVPNPEGNGGLPFKSCIPDGTYGVRPYTRSSGQKSLILSNHDNGVYEYETEIPEGEVGRYAILIHPGNTVDDVVGCIAPGLSGGEKFVSSSRAAMDEILKKLGEGEHTLEISAKGTE